MLIICNYKYIIHAIHAIDLCIKINIINIHVSSRYTSLFLHATADINISD